MTFCLGWLLGAITFAAGWAMRAMMERRREPPEHLLRDFHEVQNIAAELPPENPNGTLYRPPFFTAGPPYPDPGVPSSRGQS